MNRRWIAGFTLAVSAFFILSGWAIIAFVQGRNMLDPPGDPSALIRPFGWGVVVGIELAVWMALAIAFLPVLRPARRMIETILSQVRPTASLIVLVSLSAGISEELFFRAALQPLTGLWIASLLFALAHVGVRLDCPRTLLGAYAFLIGALLGFVYDELGFVAAATAHAVYDVAFLFLFLALIRRWPLRDPASPMRQASGTGGTSS